MSGMGSELGIVKKIDGSKDESEDGGWYDRSDHPLLNHVVLSEVFQHTKSRDLKACRGVCKTWYASTIPFTRSKWIVRIDGRPHYTIQTRAKKVLHDRIEGDPEYHGIEKFIQVFSKNQLGIPFGRFRLGSFCMTDGAGQEFLKLCGNLATYIDLHNDDNDDRFDVEDVSELLKSASNLVKFHIPKYLGSRSDKIVKLFPDDCPKPKLSFMRNLKSNSDYPEERRKCCPTFFEELLSVAENISHLTLRRSCFKRKNKPTMFTSMEVLGAVEKLGRESTIQTIKFGDMDLIITSEYFELLSRMQAKGLKLKRLGLSRYVGSPLNVQLATLFKDTLEHYSPVQCSNFVSWETMPRLNSLKLLTMTNFDSGCTDLCKIFPALEYFHLSFHRDSVIYDEFLSASEPCPKMKTFILGNACMRLKSFTQIQTVFPNLTNLQLKVSLNGVEILRSIWSGMTQLRTLYLLGKIQTTHNENLDSIFTGLSTRALQNMDKLINNLDKMKNEKLRTQSIEEIINGTSRDVPSIRSLTNLSHLHLDLICERNVGECEVTYLTPMTGYLSFYSMKHICHLMVETCQFTKTCCEILTADMGLESWKFKNSEGEQIIPKMKAD